MQELQELHHKKYEGEKDYDIPSIKGIADHYEVFECQLPFARTNLKRFMEKVDLAALVTKNFGLATQKLSFVTIKALSNELKTEAW